MSDPPAPEDWAADPSAAHTAWLNGAGYRAEQLHFLQLFEAS